ncbi:MAG: BMP family protein [Lactobacillales bacterium]|jgi:basic membrane protein A|nr:BMP family protein [Lactobacillales bacterium]
MKKAKLFGMGALALGLVATLGACGNKTNSNGEESKGEKFTVALITDNGGVDDKSFNQSAWEGLEAWGKEKGLKKGVGGFDYFQSQSESDFQNNINQAVQGKFDVVYGIGFALKSAFEESAKQNPDTKFVLVDDVIEGQKNVASATFADQEGAYLAGVAAAKTTKTGKVGFIGGMEGEVISRFQAGFVKGVASVDKNIKVEVKYAGSFGDAAIGKTITHAMIASGVDVLYQAAGGTGAGVFSEAKADNSGKNADAKDKVWVIGVDRDQKEEGKYTSKDGKEENFTLASTVKGVGAAVKAINKLAEEDKFPGGKHLTYGIKDGGVDLVDDNMSEEAQKAVDSAREELKAGKIDVPEK